MKVQLISIGVLAALLAGCQQASTEGSDVTEARQDAANALTRAESQAMIRTANADFDVAETAAEGNHEVATQRCDALLDVARDSCMSTADATLASNRREAIATRDAALLDAEYHE